MKASNVSFVPLQLASLCLDCELITPAPQGRCMACGSVAVLGIARTLNQRAMKRAPRSDDPVFANVTSRHPVSYGDFLHST
ncbi:MAG TPA: hypothetical protein VEF05_08180 [Terriglobales bacterium]|nr:hypothetical protein [Terriglobales bacterium]